LALVPLALSPVGLYSGFAKNGLALIPLALSPVGLYSGLTDNGLALISLALSPVGLYSGFAENGLAPIPVARFPVALSPVGPYSGWPLVRFTIFSALALFRWPLVRVPVHDKIRDLKCTHCDFVTSKKGNLTSTSRQCTSMGKHSTM
jgi:hypothetical protein